MSKNYNKNITLNMRNPGKAFINMSKDELAEFFSNGLPRISKEKCKNSYSLTDFRRGILQMNCLTRIEQHTYLTDLMMFALGKIEDLEQTVEDLNIIIKDYENQENTETDDKKEETEI